MNNINLFANKLIIFNLMFGNLFKKEESESKDKPVSKSKSLFDNYISTKKEISYLEDKYDDFLLLDHLKLNLNNINNVLILTFHLQVMIELTG